MIAYKINSELENALLYFHKSKNIWFIWKITKLKNFN